MKLRVLSYNIHKGFNLWNTKKILHEIKLAIQSTGADIVLLQEVVGGPSEAQFEVLADTIWPHYSYGKNAIYDQSHHGNAVLSKYPITKWAQKDISTNRFEQRGLLFCELELVPINKKLNIINLHLDLLHINREKQIQDVINYTHDHIAAEKNLIVCGDFNDWPKKISPFLQDELKLTECFKDLTGAYAQTFPSFWPKLSLDRFYSRHILALNAVTLNQTPWNELSDHLPILVDLEIN